MDLFQSVGVAATVASQPMRERAAQRRASRPSFIDENQFYSVDEAAAFQDACKATVCAEFKSGKLKAIKSGKRTK